MVASVFKDSLAYNVLSRATVMIVVFILIFGFFRYQNIKESVDQKLQYDIKTIESLLMIALPAPLWDFNVKQIDSLIESQEYIESLSAITLSELDLMGRSTYYVRKGAFLKKSDVPLANSDHLIEREMSILKGTHVLAKCTLFLSVEKYESKLEIELILLLVQQLLIAGCLIVAFYFFTRVYIGRPLSNLHDSLTKISHDEPLAFDENLPNNEIKALAEMYASVYNRLKDYQNNLELKVSQRTVDLESANENLKTEIKTRIEAEIELIEARKRADKANTAKTVFLSHITHELRTPLNGIIGYTQILARSDLEKSTKEYVSHINRCGEHLLALINNILDLNKIESGAMELVQKPMNLAAALDNVMSIIDQKSRAKGLDFNLDFSDEIPVNVIGDEEKIKQVIINLLGNAIKFTNKGTVCLSVSVESAGIVRFSVEDTGQGILKKDQECIFEPFRQSKGSTSKEASTGLGLSISRDMVALMGGELKVISETGKGSCFYFEIELPVDKTAGMTVKDAEPTGLFGTEDVHILVVDDVLDNRVIMSTRLKQLGFSVDVAEGAQEAYGLIEREKPSLIFMDIEMPEIDGLQATKAILSQDQSIKVVAFTASIHFEAFLKNEEHSLFSDYLFKPVHDRDLLRCLAKHLVLDLEYAEHSRPAVSRELTIEDMIALFGTLPKQQRQDLEVAQRKGNMSKVRKIAKEIEAEDGFNDFGKRLQNLAQQYQLDALNQIILN